eukprot:2128823-Rhodomonas_salina.1
MRRGGGLCQCSSPVQKLCRMVVRGESGLRPSSVSEKCAWMVLGMEGRSRQASVRVLEPKTCCLQGALPSSVPS